MARSVATATPLVLRRAFDAKPERVFRAWTEPDELLRWYAPAEGWTVSEAKVDLRVGGRFRVRFGPPGEEPWVESGRYREIDPPRRLVFSMKLARGKETVSDGSICTVDLVDLGGRTEVVLIDQGPDGRQHAEGWRGALANLATALASG